MKQRRKKPAARFALGGATAAFGLVAVAVAAPLVSSGSDLADASLASAETGAGDGASERLSAMQRDLGLSSPAEAERLLAQEQDARVLESELRESLGEAFGGSTFDGETGELIVSVTDEGAVDEVREAGADPRVVTYGEETLDGVVADLNAHAPDSEQGVTGWYVDTADDSVVITVEEGESPAAEKLMADAGVSGGAVRVEESSEQPRLFADIVGGDPYFIGGTGRCSIGFAVEGGFVTAGHCGPEGTSAQSEDGSGTGTVADSVFPGSDMGFVQVDGGWNPTPTVNDYQGGTITITGSQEAGPGDSVCRSGSTTGVFCGIIESENQTVVYPEGSVSGLTRTDVCAEPGDSGGSWYSGDQAQGVTSGGSGNCTTGGVTFFQPVNPILDRFGLTLVTG
ncbi:streptogrisin C [Spinactinospora alkalitolerans]|uniref:Streptogrisin C n=1 Tax=Spinactinospora alkalitolerans TaxID=687207 RepID=A0A852TU92_9ACTN|nr:S1 family peptidase [Spinactinospora alkalitolerans]NYE45694.1 streptogrisin C [Spinactinospora alkalitolerans]